MSVADTTLGGGNRTFPETTWEMVSRILDSQERPRGLEDLCRRYWKPVYRYIRIAWSKENEDAKDLTQAFFLWLMEDDPLLRYSPEKGSFRPYLKTLLNRFVGHRQRALQSLKRGGTTRILRLDQDVADEVIDDPRHVDPETAFDRQWMLTVFHLAIERVRRQYERAERSGQFKVYEQYDLCESERPTYPELAARLGMREAEVRQRLSEIRDRIREEIIAELKDTTSGSRELQEEWNVLFS